MTALSEIARFVVHSEPAPRLEPMVAAAVADCFGCILAGSESDPARRARDGLAGIAAGEVPALGTTARFAPGHAALVNAVAGHALGLDDWEEVGCSHPSVVMVPALLAAAHMRPASGARFFEAYCVGFETISRIGQAVTLHHHGRGFDSTATLGAAGAAAAVARLNRLDQDQTADALAIAVTQAVGYMLQFGTNAEQLQAGFAARAGFEAVRFAAAGISSRPEVLDDARGFGGLLGAGSEEQFRRAVLGLGRPWALEERGVILKPWPSCASTHRQMTIALRLRDRVAGRLDEITGLHATIPDFHDVIPPVELPETAEEAKLSVPACIAQMLVHGRLGLQDIEAGFWRDPEVERLIRLTTVSSEPARTPALDHDPGQPDLLTIHFGPNESIHASCVHPLGAPRNPMSPERLAAKFHEITGRDPSGFSWILTWPAAPDIARFFAEAAA